MQGHCARKFTASELVVSSYGRDWPLIAVDVRSHPAGAIKPFVTESTELTLILSDPGNATVLRSANGIRQTVRWSRLSGQVGGPDTLIPVDDQAAIGRSAAMLGASPGHRGGPAEYTSSGVRPASLEWGRAVL
jgi:hypothetical protein